MSTLFQTFLLGTALAAAVTPAFGADAEKVQAQHAKAELIAENTSFGPGENWVALRLVPDPGWHVYWINPGDSGQSTSIAWSLPSGATAGPIEWPAPHTFRLGALVNYGYGEEVLHLVRIAAPVQAAGSSFRIAAEASWLVCQEACIPGGASLELSLPYAARPSPDPQRAAAFARARAALPRDGAALKARFATAGGVFALTIDGGLEIEGGRAAADKAEFFPEPNDLVDHSSPQAASFAGGALHLEQKLSPYFERDPAEVRGVLVLHQGTKTQAFRILALPAAKPKTTRGS